jgi:hypothetical protein
MQTLGDLPNIEALEDAGLQGRQAARCHLQLRKVAKYVFVMADVTAGLDNIIDKRRDIAQAIYPKPCGSAAKSQHNKFL